MQNFWHRRARAIQRLKDLVSHKGNPRLQMLLFLLATGLAGFLSSILLHAAGLTSMGIRYPLAVGLAYLVFLLLLGLWLLFLRRDRKETAAGSTGDAVDTTLDLMDDADVDVLPAVNFGSTMSSSSKSSGIGFDVGDSDSEGIVALIVVALIVVALGSAVVASAYVLIDAPVLMAEVLVDGGLLFGLSRRMRSRNPHWTMGVIRRTWIPVLIVAGCFSLVGFALGYFAPGAVTMGEALRIVSH